VTLAGDVAIVGGGPAGVAAAIALRRVGLGTVLVEASRYETPRVGETLTPEVRPALARLGLSVEGHATPETATESAWGTPGLTTRPRVLNPYGGGEHVDRAAFDAALAGQAETRGATVLLGCRVHRCEPSGTRSWRLTTDRGPVTAAAVICATGRGAGLARALGARRTAADRLVGVAVEYADPVRDHVTLIEAARDGWWYSVALPSARRMVVFMTDSDLCRGGRYPDPGRWADAISRTRHVRERVQGLRPRTRPRVVSAVSQRLARPRISRPWLATGDAAMSVDPATGRGVLGALLAGEAAGTAMAHWLLGDQRPATAYEHGLDVRYAGYLEERAEIYGRETRWPQAPFWRRRAAPSVRASSTP
jgi:flavin-dependent dehydrogenase